MILLYQESTQFTIIPRKPYEGNKFSRINLKPEIFQDLNHINACTTVHTMISH
jgi:hypothetical protein